MAAYLIKCKKCRVVLSQKLNELSVEAFAAYDQSNNDGKAYIPQGLFYQAHEDLHSLCEIPKGNFIIHLDDIRNYGWYNEGNRLLGCCGPSGTDGLNLKCIHGHEVGTESSDCIGAHLIHFDAKHVYVHKVNEGLETLIAFIRTENGEDHPSIQSVRELTDNELERDAFVLITETLYLQQAKINKETWDLIEQTARELNIDQAEYDMLKELR